MALRQRREAATAELNALRNAEPGSELSSPADEPLPPPPPALEALRETLRANNPTVAAKGSAIEQAKLKVDLAHREYYPDFVLGGYYGYSGDLPDMWQLRVDLKVPLYYWKKQRNQVRESDEMLREAESDSHATLRELEAALQTAHSQASSSRDLITLYSKQIVPTAALTVESSVKEYQTGSVDFLTVLSNLVTQREYEMSQAEEVLTYRNAMARIAEITSDGPVVTFGAEER